MTTTMQSPWITNELVDNTQIWQKADDRLTPFPGNLTDRKSMLRAMCGVQLKDRKKSKDMMLIYDLNETIDQWQWQTLFVGMVMC